MFLSKLLLPFTILPSINSVKLTVKHIKSNSKLIIYLEPEPAVLSWTPQGQQVFDSAEPFLQGYTPQMLDLEIN